ncbi:M15 family metallopeptidase [Thiohalophilus sp.]|uniref:M15 family metallopeptidase n=1 Tax=Thiohalophilus sp. TaxID=3028392 RepID=UPI002ACDDCCF|nr:M15 family metallopeptidase [Thiohalophilus sp.]MDZ7804071.1 M15 family metallopeptidase [Thiohalophilus sp.]
MAGTGNEVFAYSNPLAGLDDEAIRDQLEQAVKPAPDKATDIQLDAGQLSLLKQSVAHLEKVQKLVGHGNFALLGFDQMLSYARNYPAVGEFSRAELDFFERVFETDAHQYGFMGEKVIARLTENIRDHATIKVPYTGNYLYRDASLQLYRRLKKDVGEDLVLTSGIRGVVKQLYLFLAKAVETRGDLALASHSLAPPGYSFHGIGDFDVGKRNLGYANFTAEFADTDVFERLVQLGYVDIRYTDGNKLGVRYEPWHIKVI